MTTGIKSYSTTAASNNATPPNGAPEGMAISDVNNCMRQMMAETRKWYEDPQWFDFGHAGLAYVSTTSFKMTGDKTAIYQVHRRVRAIGSTPFTIYGTITASSFSSPDTTVTVVWDSGTLNNTLTEIAVGNEITTKPQGSDGIQYRDASIPYAALSGVPSVPPAVPTGSVFPYVGSTAPTGYVLLSNRPIS